MEILKVIWRKLLEKEAIEPVILDMSQTNVPTEYFIIMTANSSTHMKSLREDLLDLLKGYGVNIIYYDKEDNHDWLIIDASNIVIHIFTKEARSFYDLEGLWIDAKRIEVEKR
ncbi:ribosome silencing factor [Thermosipho melanesiensis]|uniref:Ribosomal silencing factor RsfS n=2 Tax=Thermosipho melanesiensis TaxID=46541 RepID=A6LNB0_THEM4|nr:ribosome silencing factor [Thermosipho melanesiensis]ABR31411.1 iojap-like protein [Thermosipho melanesiensis BI429]APT74470.1 hypothetical protein BW47_08310 [Thermosipho melanesiensis]